MGLISRVSSRTYRCLPVFLFAMSGIPSFYADQRTVSFSVSPEITRYFQQNWFFNKIGATMNGDLFIGDFMISFGLVRGATVGLSLICVAEFMLNCVGYEMDGFSARIVDGSRRKTQSGGLSRLCVVLMSSIIGEVMHQNNYFGNKYMIRF